MSPSSHPVFTRLRGLAQAGPIVVAHRGDSRHCPENTLAAFRAAADAGVAMQEFDVRCTRDGVLVCLHDASLDRTTDSAAALGPGALVAQATWPELQRLDAGGWHSRDWRGERIPRLHDALAVMRDRCVPMIEHKAGTPADYVAVLRQQAMAGQCIVQSFDWEFVRAAGQLAPELALAVLGPTPANPRLDATVITTAKALGAGLVHWHARELSGDSVAAAHAAGLLVCSYTTDDDLAWSGGAALGFDAMCTNDPRPRLAGTSGRQAPNGPER
ncbi:MAG: glycerophosphodiester phosphodiesterase family protein [Planctomycetota bacterium]